MYEYLDREPEVGDVVVWNNAGVDVTWGKPYLVTRLGISSGVELAGNPNSFYGRFGRNTIKTKPGSEVVIGDTIVLLVDGSNPFYKYSTGDVATVVRNTVSNNAILSSDGTIHHKKDFLVLCKKVEDKNRPIAYYRRSGRPWTRKNMMNIIDSENCIIEPSKDHKKRKYLYQGYNGNFYLWEGQDPSVNPSKYDIRVYEDEYEKDDSRTLFKPNTDCMKLEECKIDVLNATDSEAREFMQILNNTPYINSSIPLHDCLGGTGTIVLNNENEWECDYSLDEPNISIGDFIKKFKPTKTKKENNMNKNNMNKNEIKQTIRELLCDEIIIEPKKETVRLTDLQKAKEVTLEVQYFSFDGSAATDSITYTCKKKEALILAEDVLRTPTAMGWTMWNKTDKVFTRVKQDIEVV